MMIKEPAASSAEKFNCFLVKCGMSIHCGPETLLMGRTLNFKKQCQHKFGTSAQAHVHKEPRNNMLTRMLNEICSRPNTNGQGGCVLVHLTTGETITWSKVMAVPLTDAVKNKAEEMAIEQGITELKFTNKKGKTFGHHDWIAGVDHDALNGIINPATMKEWQPMTDTQTHCTNVQTKSCKFATVVAT